MDWVRLAVLIWASAALALLARAGWGWGQLARAAGTARPVVDEVWQRRLRELRGDLRVRRSVRLLESDETGVPVTWGVLRPCILLPAEAKSWPSERARAVLLHELAHVQRLDALTQLAATAACALHWPNPLAWLTARSMRLERERACDDRVLAAGARPSDYASSLIDIARSVHRSRGPAAALAMARRSQLEGRLLAVLDPFAARRPLSRRGAVVACAAACALVVPLAALQADEPRPPRRDVALAESPWPASAASHPAAEQKAMPAPVAAPRPIPRVADARAIAPTPPEPAAPPTPPTPPTPPAPPAQPDRGSTTSWHSDNGERATWTSSWTEDDGRSAQLHATGEVSAAPDLRDFALTPGATVDITQREPGTIRQATLRSDAQGNVARSLVVNGREQPWDAAAGAWLASFIEDLDRHTAFAAKARLPRLLRDRGVDGTLSEIERMTSAYAKGVYLGLLLDSTRLDGAQLTRTIGVAGSLKSDYERGKVLNALAARYDFADAGARTAFLDAAAAMKSDYELGRVLQGFIGKEKLDGAQTQAVLTAAARMKSDYEKANVLIALAQRKLVQPATRLAYLDTAGTVNGDYEHARVLKAFGADPALDAQTLASVAEQAGKLRSDYEAASVLVQLAGHRALAGPAREAYRRAAEGLRSQYERQRALAALAQARE